MQISLYDQFHFQVHYDDAVVADYVSHSLWPFVKPSAARRVAFHIYVSQKPLGDAAITQFNAERKAFLQAHTSAAPFGSTPGDAFLVDKVLIDPDTNGQVVNYRFKNEVFVLNGNFKRLLEDLTRVVKQLLIYNFEKSGGYLFHASAVALGDAAVLFIGRSGAGKTTLSLAAARACAQYVSNDRAFLRRDGGEWRLFGWVDPIRVIHTVGEEKRIVSLHDYFGGDQELVVSKPTPLRWVVFPQITADAANIVCEEISAADGEARLVRGRMPPYDGGRSAWPGLGVGSGIRCYTLSCRFEEADAAVAALLRTLGTGKENAVSV